MINHKILSFVWIFCIILTGCNQNQHDEVRKDLGIYFTNTDAVIESIRQSLRNHDSKIIISYTSHRDNMQEISILVRELMQYAFDETDSPTEGDYLFHQYGGYTMHYGYEIQNEEYHYQIEIEPEYYTTLAQEQKVTERIQEVLKELNFNPKDTDDDKIRKIYDYVYQHVDYDLVHKKNEHYHLKATAYGALIYGRAVCQGYAVLLYRLFRECGIDTRIITGMAEMPDGSTEFHAWNIVRIEDKYYHLDVTWDKQMQTEAYFLKSDEHFQFHIRDERYASDEFYQAYPMAEQDYSD